VRAAAAALPGPGLHPHAPLRQAQRLHPARKNLGAERLHTGACVRTQVFQRQAPVVGHVRVAAAAAAAAAATARGRRRRCRRRATAPQERNQRDKRARRQREGLAGVGRRGQARLPRAQEGNNGLRRRVARGAGGLRFGACTGRARAPWCARHAVRDPAGCQLQAAKRTPATRRAWERLGMQPDRLGHGAGVDQAHRA